MPAIADWFALLEDTPQGAPWEADLRRTIEQVGAIHKIEVAGRLAKTQARPLTPNEIPGAARAIPGPSRSDMEAASQLPKGQQDAMIQGMVDGLETKLKANPADVDRWIMLMRSRMTLGETAKAAQALKDGIAANPGAAGRLKAQAQMLGIEADAAKKMAQTEILKRQTPVMEAMGLRDLSARAAAMRGLAEQARKEGKFLPYAAHNGNFRVDLAAVPLGAKIAAVAMLDLLAKAP